MSSELKVTVIIRLYSILRERNGQIVDTLECELPKNSQVSDVLRRLDVPDTLDIILAVNDQVVSESATLQDGDRLSLIPAVAGGSRVS